jgi:hypothetical protein
MDLLGRKLGLNNGQALNDLLKEMQTVIESAKATSGLAGLAEATEKVVGKLQETARYIAKMANSEQMMTAYAHAYSFMDLTGDVVMAWMLLWRAVVAAQKLAGGAKKKDIAFYEGQMKSATFFIKSVLPVALGKAAVILDGDDTVVQISEDAFGGK